MAWIKRNLYFVVIGVVAVALLGLSGWYLFSGYVHNNEVVDKLNEQYATLQTLNVEKPHPGSGGVDNILTAREQRQQMTNYVRQARKYFQRIPAIPDAPKVTSQDFTSALRRTLDQLTRDAAAASVNLPPEGAGYSFSFSAQRQRVSFATNSLEPLSFQLGEVKAICDVLFRANINWLDNLRRERVSPDDASGQITDFLGESSVTNELAILTHYEVTFRCFSSELASVLAGFASSPYSIEVKAVNVELASAAPLGASNDPNAPPPPERQSTPEPKTVESRGGLPTVLDEKQLRITMALQVVKLLPPK